MSRRQQILDSINTRLSTIAPSAGWGATPLKLSSLPAIAWRDTVEKADDNTFGLPQRYRLRVAIAGYVNGSAGSARTILEQILEAIGLDTKHNRLAERTTLLSIQLKVSQAADVVAAGLITLDIFYRSLIAEKYTEGLPYLIDEYGNILTDQSEYALEW